MISWKRYIPEGTKDTLFEECTRKVEIENILRKTYTCSGFLEVKSPTLEFYDVFSGESSTLAQEKMYKLFDNHGRILVLRPDMTTPIARIAATKLKEVTHPLRLCYTSNVYRVNESLNGKNSEITQSGIEIIGVKSLKADAEAIITGITALINCGVEDFKVELGHAEFFKAIIEDVNIDDEEKEKLRVYIENKNFTALSEFLDKNRNSMNKDTLKILKELPKLFGNMDILDVVCTFTDNEKALEAINDIKAVYEIIKDAGLGDYVSVDLGMVHYLNYYTGIIFRGYAEGVGGNILSGGRYDNLIKQFGEQQEATGFAVNVDSIISALENCGQINESKVKKILIYYKNADFKKAYDKALKLREDGSIAELSLFDSQKEAEEYAQEKGMEFIII
ncbi:ATP phosphoribosyltransferase [Clostridium carboxidivorans P7]|uniref:ATP phosphoribosyltransferase regulatory subunit n=1 Tax=Clostridium carboxidivorans P7 TaxID=536227 RepID=C6PUR2_9CLOT|nr:ATP phosphoribosyltransferase regulatory subunit [Clostridium carboxidivorans]AKN29349.1 ATP phosphoribosyltransferase [Clostridium carboxidivorans P7]EET86991.1 histidyl-tRNA synthetase 2 [Clostridium carboxidivorans P7]EFG89740.1 ATP phosphoribosyltransferase, regulatory subunit [Clostridium carboxidivorans P7]